MRPVTAQEAAWIGAELARRLRFGAGGRAPACRWVGSVRRGEETHTDLDLLVRLSPARLRAGGVSEPRLAGAGRLAIRRSGPRGPRRARVLVLWEEKRASPRRQIWVDLFAATAEEMPWALFHYTGPASYNVRTRAFARRKGLLLNQYGLFRADSGRRVAGSRAVRTEAGAARLLGVRARPPSDRR